MPLNFTAAHSSRIQKSTGRTPGSLRRSTSSPFAAHPRTKAAPKIARKVQKAESADDEHQSDDRLDDLGLVLSLSNEFQIRDVSQAIVHARNGMFCDIPERAGMNSTRIAEVLNFRKALPPVVSVAHVHALMGSSTATEREIADLVNKGVIRRLIVSGRGNDAAALGDGLVLTEDWTRAVQQSGSLEEQLKDKFLRLLSRYPKSISLPGSLFSSEESSDLLRAGLLVSSPSLNGNGNSFPVTNATSHQSSTSVHVVSKAPSGSLAAVGGEGAVHNSGAGGNIIRRGDPAERNPLQDAEGQHFTPGTNFFLTLPNTGSFLRLLGTARSHLVSLLGKSKYREVPMYLLRERWEGAVESSSRASNAKRIRGEFGGILPGRTKMWKDFQGLQFSWVAEEALGAGLLEIFRTGSVGLGIRAV